MRKKKIIISILGIVTTVLIIFTALLYTNVININNNNNNEENTANDVEIVIKKLQPQRQFWLANKEINEDYVGEIVFDSNLINKSFVQAKSTYDSNGKLYNFYTESGNLVNDGEGYTGNDVYIWTNWKDMSYDYNIEGGSVFMDYRNSLEDQNIIIYGHHFSVSGGNDPERVKAFTPLEELLDENNYEENSRVKLILDNNTRVYELVYVYNFDTNDENCLSNMQYYRPNYNYDDFNDVVDENYYSNYIDNLEKYKLYDTGKNLTTDDSTLTLQTCISGKDGEVFEICVFKLIDIEYYE